MRLSFRSRGPCQSSAAPFEEADQRDAQVDREGIGIALGGVVRETASC